MNIAQYSMIYWAAACLVLWAGGGAYVPDGLLAQAINGVCDEAKLTVPQEALLKRLVIKMMNGGAHGAD